MPNAERPAKVADAAVHLARQTRPALLDRRRLRLIALTLLGAGLVASMGFVLTRAGPLAPVRVTVTQAEVGRLAPSLFGIGTVEARRSYLIGPTAASRVSRVLVDVGDVVQAGQLLAEMDPIDLDHRAAALDASVARAASVVASAQAQRRDALARNELAAIAARRYRELGEQNFVSAAAVESKFQERTSAEAGVALASANVDAARRDGERLKAERAGLVQQRENARLRAPARGVVISRDAEPGSTVVAGQAVLRIIDPASLWVRLRLDQGRSAGLTGGLVAAIVLRSNPSTDWRGTVSRVEVTSDSITEERIAMVSFDSLPPGLTTGEMAEVRVTLPMASPTLLLPSAAIRRQADRVGVWRVQDGGIEFVAIRVGQVQPDGRAQVLDGLVAGDVVVVYSESELSSTTRIKVVKTLIGGQP